MARILPFVFVLTTSVGCAHNSRTIPAAALPLASADYVVGDWIEGEACGNYLLGFRLASLFQYRGGELSGGFGWGLSAEHKEAIYDALENAKTATHLFAPRYRVSSNGFILLGTRPLFGQRCVLVSARTVTLKSGPVPRAK
ncbi:MAG: hypothetical protein CMH55_07905 [Myxococcales bacterium]|nr:hypothetical protein [Myxococcales bacterium]